MCMILVDSFLKSSRPRTSVQSAAQVQIVGLQAIKQNITAHGSSRTLIDHMDMESGVCVGFMVSENMNSGC